ncbi:MAG: endonuclease domain-containing protein [Fimbriimonadaceae bacterium]
MATRGQKLARFFRSNPTVGEDQLWRALRHLDDPRFRRQKPFGPYVLDFYAPRYRLAIEIDGPYHDADRDHLRDAWLLARGVYTIRVKWDEMNPDVVLDEVAKVCAWLKPRFRRKRDA